MFLFYKGSNFCSILVVWTTNDELNKHGWCVTNRATQFPLKRIACFYCVTKIPYLGQKKWVRLVNFVLIKRTFNKVFVIHFETFRIVFNSLSIRIAEMLKRCRHFKTKRICDLEMCVAQNIWSKHRITGHVKNPENRRITVSNVKIWKRS